MRSLLLLLLTFFSQALVAQVYQSRNFLSDDFHTLSYRLQDSALLIGTETGVLCMTKTDTFQLAGQKAVMHKEGKEAYTLETKANQSILRRYDAQFKLLDSLLIAGKVVDLCYGKGKELFVLQSTNTADQDDLAEVLRVKKGKLKNRFFCGMPEGNVTTIAYESKRKYLLIGGASNGAILTRKGGPRYGFSSPHWCYTQSFRHGLFAVYHRYSDASVIEVFKTPGKTAFTLKHELDTTYRIGNSPEESHLAVFSSFDFSPQTDYMLALDHSNALTVFQPSGQPIEQICRNEACVFAFFLHDEVIAWYHKNKKKLIIVQPKKIE